MSLQCSNICRRMRHGIFFDLMRVFGGCGGYKGGYLISRKTSDQVFIFSNTVEVLLQIGGSYGLNS